MNEWLKMSIDYASQRSYLDDLFRVYPTVPEGLRDLDKPLWASVEAAFEQKDNIALMESLLKLKLFPVKDSYVAFLKKDKSALHRNPATVARLCGRLYEIGIDEIFKLASAPIEANRQIGPLFRRWLQSGSLGIKPVDRNSFLANKKNAILDESDSQMKEFARKYLGYKHDKGLDLVGRFNGKYILGEAKFLTDNGGHQNAQFKDAIATLKAKGLKAKKVAILDGVCYIKSKNKMHRSITGALKKENIMSSLVLREFLYQL